MRKVPVPNKDWPSGREKLRKRQVTLHGYIQAIEWHRIDVRDEFEIGAKEDGKVLERWMESKSHKAYSFNEAGGEFEGLPDEDCYCRGLMNDHSQSFAATTSTHVPQSVSIRLFTRFNKATRVNLT